MPISPRLRLCAALLFLGLACGVSQASVIVYGTYSDHPVADGSELSDVRMSVDMTVSGGLATMTFTNVSVYPELTASFKTIAVDWYDEDTSQRVLWNPVVLNSVGGVSYDSITIASLPAIPSEDTMMLIGLSADPPPTKKGLAPGKMLQVRFNTSLADGSTIEDYLAFFDGGNDTAVNSLGFHAISATTVSGQSMVGTYIPEPTAMAMLMAGGGLLALRRRKRGCVA